MLIHELIWCLKGIEIFSFYHSAYIFLSVFVFSTLFHKQSYSFTVCGFSNKDILEQFGIFKYTTYCRWEYMYLSYALEGHRSCVSSGLLLSHVQYGLESYNHWFCCLALLFHMKWTKLIIPTLKCYDLILLIAMLCLFF